MKLFQSIACPHCGASLNNHMDATVCPRCNKDLSAPADADSASAGDPSSLQPAASSGSLMRRYKDAYLMARTVTAFGATVKVLAFVVGGAVAFIGLVAASQSALLAIGGILLGTMFVVPIYVLSILVSAQGQILKATLDSAVNSSPLLTKDEMLQIMSLH